MFRRIKFRLLSILDTIKMNKITIDDTSREGLRQGGICVLSVS
jgi:hypothetical protein